MVCLLVSCTLCVAVRRILIERGRRRNDHPRALTGYLTLYHHHYDDGDNNKGKEEEEEELLQEEKECGHHQGPQA